MNSLSFVLAFLVAFSWSVAAIMNKYLLQQRIDVIVLMLISSLTFALCNIVWSLYNKDIIRQSFKGMSWKTLLLLVLAGLIGIFIPNVLLLNVLKNNDSHIVIALTYTTPLFVSLLAYAFLNEQIKMESLIGIILIVSGIIMIGRANIN
jgi:hypothetical protein